jgi:glycosyltransferase involved in cell wall biosynthesis
MHVVILGSARHPLREPFAGGLESLTWALVRGLRQRGVDVTLFAGPGSDPALDARQIRVSPLDISQAARADISMPPQRWLEEHHAYLQVMLGLQRRTDVDVVHNNSLHYLPLALAASIEAPMVTTLHTPPTPWLEPAIALMDQRRARFVAVSAHTAGLWRHVAPATVIHNGIDPARWPAGPGGPDVVWFGRLVPEKAPHEALRIARAAGRGIRIAGPIGDHGYFADKVQPLLGPGAEYMGHLDRAALAELVGASAACVVTPAWDEPFGLVAAESMACGTPVVGYRRGGLPEFVAPEGGRLVEPGNIDAAARAIEAVMTIDRDECRAHVVSHASLDRMVGAYMDVYAVAAELRTAA